MFTLANKNTPQTKSNQQTKQKCFQIIQNLIIYAQVYA